MSENIDNNNPQIILENQVETSDFSEYVEKPIPVELQPTLELTDKQRQEILTQTTQRDLINIFNLLAFVTFSVSLENAHYVNEIHNYLQEEIKRLSGKQSPKLSLSVGAKSFLQDAMNSLNRDMNSIVKRAMQVVDLI